MNVTLMSIDFENIEGEKTTMTCGFYNGRPFVAASSIMKYFKRLTTGTSGAVNGNKGLKRNSFKIYREELGDQVKEYKIWQPYMIATYLDKPYTGVYEKKFGAEVRESLIKRMENFGKNDETQQPVADEPEPNEVNEKNNNVEREGHIRFFELDGCFYFRLQDVARGMNLVSMGVDGRKDVNWELVCGSLVNIGVMSSSSTVCQSSAPEYISENNYYLFAQHVKGKDAEAFNKEMITKIIPNIHKRKACLTEEEIENTLSDPDYLIMLANRMKDYRTKNTELQNKLKESEAVVTSLKKQISQLKDTVNKVEHALNIVHVEEEIDFEEAV